MRSRLDRCSTPNRTAVMLAVLSTVLLAPQTVGADEVAKVDEIELFCSNIADAARDRRYLLQETELTRLREEIDLRIDALEAKRAEYEEWLARRNSFLEQAERDLVEIYSGMRPDAAAERLSEVRVELAAAILMKLEPRNAATILNEMDSKTAGALTTIMASAVRPSDPS